MLQTSKMSRICKNECRILFCMSGTTDGILHPVGQSLFRCATFKVETLSIFFSLQEAVTRKPLFREYMFKQFFFCFVAWIKLP